MTGIYLDLFLRRIYNLAVSFRTYFAYSFGALHPHKMNDNPHLSADKFNPIIGRDFPASPWALNSPTGSKQPTRSPLLIQAVGTNVATNYLITSRPRDLISKGIHIRLKAIPPS